MADPKEEWANGIMTALQAVDVADRVHQGGNEEEVALLELIRTLALMPEVLLEDKDPALVFALGEIAGVADRHLAKYPKRRRLHHG